MSVLTKIFDAKRQRLAQLGPDDRSRMRRKAEDLAAQSNSRSRLRSALSNDTVNIIAEFKRASPSLGAINASADPCVAAATYAAGGAAGISVLTEEDFFSGSLDDLRAVRAATDLPILRKDFILDSYQIHEAVAAGADAILLIAAMLNDGEVLKLADEAEVFGIDALVEVHTLEEMHRAARSGCQLIGVNNRDLRTFDVSLAVCRRLVEAAPSDAVLVAESGLKNADDIAELHALGYRGFLIGEALMKSSQAGARIRELRGAAE